MWPGLDQPAVGPRYVLGGGDIIAGGFSLQIGLHDMTGGSNQQRQFRIAIRDCIELNAAAGMAGIGIIEAKLIIADDAKFPPPPEAFQLITSPIQGQPKEAAMARAARKPKDENGGEVPVKDFDLAKRLYQNDIKPAVSKAGEAMQEASTAFKQIKKVAHIQPAAAKLAFKLADMEDAKRDDFLRCLGGLLKSFGIDVAPKDMVDVMNGSDGYKRPPVQLVTVPTSDGSETDLADAADPEFTEATAEELAQQEGRPAADTDAPDDATEEGEV